MSRGTWPGMSGNVETYSNRRRAGAFWRVVRRTILLVLAVLLVYAWWFTRDTYPRWRLIPAGQKLTLVVSKPLDNRERVLGSGVWKALPPPLGLTKRVDELKDSRGIPEWILRNIIGRNCYITANDLRDMGDALFITKMSRIGCAVERCAVWFSPRIEREYAGGLYLRKVVDTNLYYAVRGRSLVASRSREALVASLTLRNDASLNQQTFEKNIAGGGREDLRGNAALSPADPLGNVFQSVGFAFRFDTYDATVKCTAMLSPEWEQRLAPVLDGVQPRPLVKPMDGMLTVSADLGKPIPAVANAIMEAFADKGSDGNVWGKWEAAPADGQLPLAYMVSNALEGAGSGARLTVQGIDLNEIVPMPQVVIQVDGGSDGLKTFEGKLADAKPADAASWPVLDKKTGVLCLPMVGGTSIEPSVGPYQDGLVLSNSRPAVASLVGKGPYPASPSPGSGNVYVCVRPLPCTKAVTEAGKEFADIGALRGYTPGGYRSASSEWLQWAARVDEITVLASHDGTGISVEAQIKLAR